MRRLLLSLLTALGCNVPTEPLPYGHTVPPDPLWSGWYVEVWTACGSAVVQAPAYRFEDLEFRVVPRDSLISPATGQPALGLWQGNRIYIADDMVREPLVVRHEMLHAQIGEPGHPPIFTRCDSLAVGL